MSLDKFSIDKVFRGDKGKPWEPIVTANTLNMSQAGGSDVALRAQSGELTVDGLLSQADRAYQTINQFVAFPDEMQRLKIEESVDDVAECRQSCT